MKTLDNIKREATKYVFEQNVPSCGRSDFAIYLHQYIDHLHSQGLLMVWNTDMDSAPRDGTPILAICEKVEPEISKPYTPNYPVNVSFEYGNWCVNDTVYYCSEVINPTAWMPLPPAPKGETK